MDAYVYYPKPGDKSKHLENLIALLYADAIDTKIKTMYNYLPQDFLLYLLNEVKNNYKK